MSTLSSSRHVAALMVIAMVAGCATARTPPDRAAQDLVPDTSSSREASPAQPQSTVPTSAPKPSSAAKPDLDRSGSKQVGKASFYANKFTGRKMADGTRMDPRDDNAASKTLPLGTTARVTNLQTGRSAVVIQDRGPYVKGRIVDLSPATAREIVISRDDGIAQVEVLPLSIPP
jgi:rare lipoprotein A